MMLSASFPHILNSTAPYYRPDICCCCCPFAQCSLSTYKPQPRRGWGCTCSITIAQMGRSRNCDGGGHAYSAAVVRSSINTHKRTSVSSAPLTRTTAPPYHLPDLPELAIQFALKKSVIKGKYKFKSGNRHCVERSVPKIFVGVLCAIVARTTLTHLFTALISTK